MELTFLPPLQAITLRKKDPTLSAGRNFFDFEEATLLDGLRKGALYFPYKQKVQYTDRQTVYFFTNAYYTGINSSVYLAIVNCKGEVIEEHNPDVDPENWLTETYTYKSGDIDVETDVLAYRWRYTAGTYPEGDYYIYIKVTYDSGNTEEFISEPQWVKTKHKKTVRLSYTNTTDAEEILFYTMGISFTIRIDSEYMKLVPKGEETTYKEQDEELRRLYGQYYRCFEFYIKRAPEYMIDKLGRILLNCSNLFIEDKQFIKDAGAEIEYERNNNNAVGTGKVTLREYYSNRSGLFLNTSVTILTRPGTYPYLISGFWITNGLTSGTQSAIEIVDASFETDWLTNDLNLDMIADMDAGGNFEWDGDNLIYVNAPDEKFYLLVSNPVMDKYWEFTIGSVLSAYSIQFSYKPRAAGFSGYAVYDDSSKIYKALGSADITFGETIQHQFASNGTKTMRIYTTANMIQLVWGAQPQGQTGKVSNITGGVATGSRMEYFRVFRQDIGGAFDPFALVENAASYLKELNFSENGLTSVVTTGLQNKTGDWLLLKTVQLAGNNMNQAAMDNFFNDFEQHSGYTYGGQIYIKQNPVVTPSGASLTARTDLTTAGWALMWL